MKIGICIPSHREVMPIEDTMDTARRAEEAGFDSVWVNDHIVIPDEVVHQFSARYFDAYMVLANAAARTKRVKLGTSVIVLPYRNAILQAKMLTTLDALSNGRVIFGLGVGGIEQEYKALGVPFAHRGSLADEMIRVIQELWTKGNPSFQGKHYAFSNIQFAPKPVQKPRIPMWIGGTSDASIRRAARYGDAWHPIIGKIDAVKAGMKTFADAWQGAGREGPAQVKLRIGCRIYPTALGSDRELGKGSAEQVQQDLESFKALGLDYTVLDFAQKVTQAEWNYTFDSFAKKVLPKL